jgi:GDPmannose 4,6-dehydratase
MKKTALITGANGQDASFLAEFLLEKGYEVHGTIRRNSVPESQTTRIENLFSKNLINLHYMDLTDPISVTNIIKELQPDELYHLAAQSHVGISFDLPKYTLDTNAGGTLSILEGLKRFSPHTKMYNASTSEMFGNNMDSDGFQRETTPMVAVSPYGCSKLYAHNLCHNYRNSYDIFVASGILFNHESPRRGLNFVTNKIAYGGVKIKLGLQDKLVLGNLDAKRDWGHAKDYVKGMWLMLQQDVPNDYILSTGVNYSVKDLAKYVFKRLDLDWNKHVDTSEKYKRPEELWELKGDSSRAQKELGWTFEYTFETMINEMVDYWLEYLKK